MSRFEPFFERLFEALFKYRPALFQEGELTFAAPRALAIAALALGVILVPVVLRFRATGGRTGGVDRIVLALLRLLAVSLLILCLLQPALVLQILVPQETFVGVLVDDSKSMRIQDGGELARADQVARALDPAPGSFLATLSDRFKLRLFGFSDSVRRIEGAQDLGFGGTRTDLAEALSRSAEELGATPLAGLVLLSDGADTGGASLSDVLLELRARGIPVSTVGYGRERFDRDVEVSRVVAPRSVLEGSSLLVETTLHHRGFGGRSVSLEVEDEGRIVSVQEVDFPPDGEAVTARVAFTVTEPGVRLFRFRVAPQPGEQVTQNNEQLALIEVLERKEKILYFEGEPRFELKFIRRAVADDPNLQLVCLQRTAENKFLRLDIDDPRELETGFPTSREELFRYRALILGSVEASFFSYDQMRMIVDFVSQRGGGLLTLGGRRSFAEGGYAGTPIAEVLPVVLSGPPTSEGDPSFAELSVRLTPQGQGHPALQLAPDAEGSAARWSELPPVSTFNPIFELKPGAQSLLVGTSDALPEEQVVLAHQRYGRGRSLALTLHDTWRWQMHHEIPLEDMTHENFWRQLLRWLVSYVPDPVELQAEHDRVAPGDSVELRATVRDETFLEVNGAQVQATVRAPSGEETSVMLEWSVEEDGDFRARVGAPEPGLYQVEVEALAEGRSLGTARTTFQAAELDDEFFGAEQRAELLRRIAEETGGKHYSPDRLEDLAEDLSYSGGGATMLEYRDLWDMPAIFLLLLALLGGEWVYRRTRGLA